MHLKLFLLESVDHQMHLINLHFDLLVFVQRQRLLFDLVVLALIILSFVLLDLVQLVLFVIVVLKLLQQHLVLL